MIIDPFPVAADTPAVVFLAVLRRRRNSSRGAVVIERSSPYAGRAVVGAGPLSLVGRTWRVRPLFFIPPAKSLMGSAGLVSGHRRACDDVAATSAPQAATDSSGVSSDSPCASAKHVS